MLIDCSYFTAGPRHIQNATLGTEGLLNQDALYVKEAIEAYIGSLQEEFLIEALGHSAGSRVNAYLVCLDEDTNPRHHANLDAVCEQLRESFADYVFYKILRDANTQATMTGLVRLKCANEYVSPVQRQVSIWNAMVNKNRRFAEWAKSSECGLSGIEVSSNLLTKINTLNL